ncbi:hypothetical protein [Polaribacter porphyrae]|uniref:Uncharacterized protein n=1 Tax=Polaribacter porphyrae TaxID=1137780 RepID=A0A2S7WJZ6_9FLAO|nr:hypothetical protein [Polaribacter porphyrae]PQJ77937.1 hypothetical protein BTO18_01490 [Polaribacter porphyrae]
MALILKYRLAWNHIQNKGEVILKISNSSDLIKIEVNSASEFNAIFSILNNSPVKINNNGWIFNAESENPGN